MIDKTPKSLKTIGLNHIIVALNVLAKNEVQMLDKRGEYTSQNIKHSFELRDGLFCFNKILTSFQIVVDEKKEVFYFQNKEYLSFYKRNKYSIDDKTQAIESALSLWQEKASKNFRKDVSKVVSQFERTQSVEISNRLLKLLPSLSFRDAETFSGQIKYSQIYPSLAEEVKMNRKKDFKRAEDRVARLRMELKDAEDKVLSLKQELKKT